MMIVMVMMLAQHCQVFSDAATHGAEWQLKMLSNPSHEDVSDGQGGGHMGGGQNWLKLHALESNMQGVSCEKAKSAKS